MCRLIESIKVYNKRLWNLKFHNARMNNSRRVLFGCKDEIDLSKEIIIPNNISNELYKCRVVYAQQIISIEFIPYYRKKISTLQVIINNSINYEHKYEDRSEINKLVSSVKADDILIVKNNLITDTSFANVVFSDGIIFLTPSAPLLRGTKRAKLLDEGLIREEEILLSDLTRQTSLKKFKYVYLINAMLDIDENYKIPIENINL